jgi:hypothetical protein
MPLPSFGESLIIHRIRREVDGLAKIIEVALKDPLC